MRNYFAQTLPFYKRETDTSITPHDARYTQNHYSPITHTTKKNNIHHESPPPKTEHHLGPRQKTNQEEEEFKEKIAHNSLKNVETTHKGYKYNPFLGRQKPQPRLTQISSPRIQNNHIQISQLKEEKTSPQAQTIRTTLKNLVQSKGFCSFEKQYPKEQSAVESSTMNLDGSLNISRMVYKTSQQIYGGKPLKIIQKQNAILKQQNELLKFQLAEIKKHILSGPPSKKEELISNLRDTIKKQDSQIRQLCFKLDNSHKKIATLNSQLQNKDQQINFLTNKVQQLEAELQQLKQKNTQKLQHIRQKSSHIITQFLQLQKKCSYQEIDWLNFREKWLQEKSVYLHRISFLQEYISNNN